VRQRVGATILQGDDEAVSSSLCASVVFPRPPEELSKMTRDEVRQRFPDLLAILDATNWEQFKPENFLENRLSYSAYKNMNVYQVLLGERPYLFGSVSAEKICCFSCFSRFD
jgi:hypothetical protein